jgi:hypothetical protein
MIYIYIDILIYVMYAKMLGNILATWISQEMFTSAQLLSRPSAEPQPELHPHLNGLSLQGNLEFHGIFPM